VTTVIANVKSHDVGIPMDLAVVGRKVSPAAILTGLRE